MLNRILFLATITLSLSLILFVILAPWSLEQIEEKPRWLILFAQDVVVRRTTIVCALGLFATAIVFFRNRTPPPEDPPQEEKRASRRSRTRNTVGA